MNEQSQSVFLVCEACGSKEKMTEPIGCPVCGAPRYAEDKDGKPLVLWSEKSDPTSWEVSRTVGLAIFPVEWTLTRQESRFLLLLMKAKDGFCRVNDILMGVSGRAVHPKIGAVLLCRVRRKLTKYGIIIHTRHGEGFQITPESIEILRRVATVYEPTA